MNNLKEGGWQHQHQVETLTLECDIWKKACSMLIQFDYPTIMNLEEVLQNNYKLAKQEMEKE